MKRKERGFSIPILSKPRLYLLCAGLLIIAGMATSLTGAAFLSPWLRVALGLLIFLLPGGFAFALFPPRDSWDFIDFLVYGFAFSIVFIAVLGYLTRTLLWTIDAVELVWYGLAALGFFALYHRTGKQPPLKASLPAGNVALLGIIVIQVSLFAYASVFAVPDSSDQNRHHAEVNAFLRDDPLGWSEPYYETGNPIADRMYLPYWTLAQALIVDISGAPILHARYLINPFVFILAAAGMVVFARNLGHGSRTSLIMALLGLFSYSLLLGHGLQAGSQVTVRPLLDKLVAGFVLAPVAISSAYLCSTSVSTSARWRAIFAFALSFLAAVFTHAILAGFAVSVIGLWCVLRLVLEKGGRSNAIRLGLLTLLLFSPVLLIRSRTVDTTIYNFGDEALRSDEKILVLDASNPFDSGKNFYMINPVAAGDLTYITLALVLLAVLARRVDSRSKLMLAFALAMGIGLLPYTAWIYGRLASVNHIIRVIWLMPYGYMLGFVLETGSATLCRIFPGAADRIKGLGRDRLLTPLFILSVIATAHSLHVQRRVDFSRDISAAIYYGDKELLEIAEYIESHHQDRVWILASPAYRNRVIAMNWRVISLSRFSVERMVYYSNMSVERAAMQREDNFLFYGTGLDMAERLAIIDKYDIDYLLYERKHDEQMNALMELEPERFAVVYAGRSLRFVRLG